MSKQWVEDGGSDEDDGEDEGESEEEWPMKRRKVALEANLFILAMDNFEQVSA